MILDFRPSFCLGHNERNHLSMKQNSAVQIIAEAGVNHNGSLATALQMVDVAADAGADAVKFQTFKAEAVSSRCAPKADYQLQNTVTGESQLEMLKRLELDEQGHQALIERCGEKGIQFLSTPFDAASVDLLATQLDLARIKLPSGEITNLPLLLKVAAAGKPLLLSTGMSTLGEIELALGALAYGYIAWPEQPSLNAFQQAYNSPEGQASLQAKVTLLHCTTEYPAPFHEVNLKAMDVLHTAFGLPVGLSDHTPGIAVSIAAAARGASVIEKHFTLDRELPGPDHQASLEPEELEMLVRSIRQVETALGTSWKHPTPAEWKNRVIARKSLVAACDITQGAVFGAENITAKRPGNGISPINYWEVIGRKAPKNFTRDELIEL
jgi:N-acetylneuraminate synthase